MAENLLMSLYRLTKIDPAMFGGLLWGLSVIQAS